MTLPNFLLIGAAKCATTSMASLLAQHPEAEIVQKKEPHFFSYDVNYKNGIEYYKQLFSHCSNEKAIGDASTSYSRIRQHPEVITRIQKHLNKPKIIYMVRHPLERISSAYIEQMTMLHNKNITSISEAIEKLPMMVDSSRYWETYTHYRKAFGKENIHVIWFEDYKNNHSNVFKETCSFLEIDTSFQPDLKKEATNSRNYAQQKINSEIKINEKWDKKTLAKVKKLLKNDTEKFLLHFKKPLNYWS